MPRPKRSKVTPSVPVQHVPRPAPLTSPAQKKNGFSSQSSGRVTTGSDNSDGLVIAKTRNTGKSAPMAQLYTMSGALAPEDRGSTQSKPASARMRATLSKIVREADHAKVEGEKKARKLSRATTIEEPDEVPSSIPTRAAESRRPSSGRLGLSSAQQRIQPGLEVRVYETPRIHSSSMLGGATFKKRSRQPSLLRMAESQKNASDELNDDDMYDFMPDDESTPIIKALSHERAPSTSSSSHQAPGSRKRKMKSPEVQVPASQAIEIGSSPSSVLSPSDHHEESSEDNQTQPMLPPPHSAETPPPEIFSDTLAPPQSSSSPLPESKPQNYRKKPAKAPSKAKPRSTKPAHRKFSSAPSPLSSTSTQISPVRPRAALKPLTTATLQNLLPRRRVRRRPKGDYDLPSSSDVELDNIALGEDEDELSFNATTKMRKKRPSMAPQSGKSKAKETVTGGKGKKISKTYVRKSIVVSDDDENVSESENENEARYAGRYGSRARSSTPALDSKAKEEMRRLAEKFREVDEYTLDFEDMTASSDKMKDAR